MKNNIKCKLVEQSKEPKEPGDMWYDTPFTKCPFWDNCKSHLIVVLPNGDRWDTSARASNCDKKENKTHRCWVLHGKAPNITVDKKGDTCSAGAGSVDMPGRTKLDGTVIPGWHGFLRDGNLVQS